MKNDLSEFDLIGILVVSFISLDFLVCFHFIEQSKLRGPQGRYAEERKNNYIRV